MDACRRARTVDLDFEHDILRSRAACWAKLGKHKELYYTFQYYTILQHHII